MDDIIEFKRQVTLVYSITKKDAHARLDNVTLA